MYISQEYGRLYCFPLLPPGPTELHGAVIVGSSVGLSRTGVCRGQQQNPPLGFPFTNLLTATVQPTLICHPYASTTCLYIVKFISRPPTAFVSRPHPARWLAAVMNPVIQYFLSKASRYPPPLSFSPPFDQLRHPVKLLYHSPYNSVTHTFGPILKVFISK